MEKKKVDHTYCNGHRAFFPNIVSILSTVAHSNLRTALLSFSTCLLCTLCRHFAAMPLFLKWNECIRRFSSPPTEHGILDLHKNPKKQYKFSSRDREKKKGLNTPWINWLKAQERLPSDFSVLAEILLQNYSLIMRCTFSSSHSRVNFGYEKTKRDPARLWRLLTFDEGKIDGA